MVSCNIRQWFSKMCNPRKKTVAYKQYLRSHTPHLKIHHQSVASNLGYIFSNFRLHFLVIVAKNGVVSSLKVIEIYVDYII